MNAPTAQIRSAPTADRRMALLAEVERKLLWLSAWMIHNANHLRPNRDGLKVGGHQASCASVTCIMTALVFRQPAPVRPGGGEAACRAGAACGELPVRPADAWNRWPGCGSSAARRPIRRRVKDGPEIDFSTGSVGLGVALTSFSALMQDYVRVHGLVDPPTSGRAMSPSPAMPSWTRATSTRRCSKAGSTTCAMSGGWSTTTARAWISVMPDRLFGRFEGLFRDMGWKVVSTEIRPAAGSGLRPRRRRRAARLGR